MTSQSLRFCFLLAAIPATTCVGQSEPSGALVHFGMCDASAAVAVGQERFLVANDEDNALRLYRRDRGGRAVGKFQLRGFLRTTREHPEADIEGAARMGELVYWITSHGRNKNGRRRPNRYRLFATRVRHVDDTTTVTGVGTPYSRLLDDLLGAESLKSYGLDQASRRAPKDKDGLNIEGLAATPEGKLLIGFRNPIRRGKALVVPLKNPREVIGGAAAKLGDPIELDLGGLGVRSLEYHAGTGGYLVIGGEYDGGAACQMFRWSGRAADAPLRLASVEFGNWTPEALIVYAGRADQVQILSDDGTRKFEGIDCKALPSENQRRFRSGWIRLE